MMSLTKQQRRQVKAVGKKHGLKLILLHGSYAKDRPNLDSDLDIAVLGKRELDFKIILKIHSDLAKIFGDSRKRELDLKSLHKANPLFIFEVMRDSQLLYGKPLEYEELKAYAFKFFYDAKDLFNLESLLIDRFQGYLNKKYA